MSDRIKFQLGEDDIPRSWYNLAADLPAMAPVLHPATGRPVTRDDMAHTMPEPIIDQELSTERELEIPEAVREIYAYWRPTPMFRARRLEQALGTPARIHYKYEGGAPTGNPQPNTAGPQAPPHQPPGSPGPRTP